MRAMRTLGFALLLTATAFAQNATNFRTSRIYGDHMVLPANCHVPITGFGVPGTSVVLEASWNAQADAEVDAQGRWQALLPTTTQAGPHELTLTCDNQKLVIRDILFGDVWLGSGQSNMEWKLSAAADAEHEIAAANYPQLRIFTVKRAHSGAPCDDVEGSWQVCTPENVPDFSAVAFHFSRELLAARKQPIGMVASSWGGTLCEAWTSSTGLQAFPEFSKALAAAKQQGTSQQIAAQRERFWAEAVSARSEQNQAEVSLPDVWSKSGLSSHDGTAFYERSIELPSDLRGAELSVSLGAIDDMDATYCDGTRIGGLDNDQSWDRPRKYVIPAKLTAGKERITLRICAVDTGGEGGVIGDSNDFALRGPNGQNVSIAAGWQRTIGATLQSLPQLPQSGNGQNRPAALYHAMIAPLLAFPFTGVIWYQGESNRTRAEQYAKLFPAMIADWRRAFGRELPFYFVQIAPFIYNNDRGEAAMLRLAQEAALQLPKTGMVVTLDVGDPNNIHPTDKRTVGARLALHARNSHYGEKIACDGPFVTAVTAQRGALQLTMQGCDGGLVIEAPDGFEVADDSGVYLPAVPVVQGNLLWLRCDSIAAPKHARYAFASAPTSSLRNAAGLPARPFLVHAK